MTRQVVRVVDGKLAHVYINRGPGEPRIKVLAGGKVPARIDHSINWEIQNEIDFEDWDGN